MTEAARGAMLAFAVGDSLGWPLEIRGNRVGGTRDLHPELALREWTRREGGRHAPHEEAMPAGVYSDDTQLTLAVARAQRYGSWWEYFTEVELPWWTQYELGGGGATKRAAQSWAKQVPPWDPRGAKAYWTAGGNGAAMRVLPHCVRPEQPFAEVRRRVLADGAATHGDPVALVGAQLYAYALWMTAQRRSPVGWAELLDESLEGVGDWGLLDPESVPYGWARHITDEYFDRWGRTVQDTHDLLSRARNDMAHGALTVDDEVLRELGCFSSSGGAGTITAVGALYLASRHASNPEHGLLRAAFARGADTDTLAAMTGALLGAVHGPLWLGRAAADVMDSELLSHALGDPRVGDADAPVRYERGARRHVEARLAESRPGARADLPFYGKIEIIAIHDLDNRTSWIRSWWFRNEAGQTFRVKRISRAQSQPWIPLRRDEIERPRHAADRNGTEQPNGRIRSGLVVRVGDIDRARAFYETLIGLPVSRETRSSVVLGGWLALERASLSSESFQTTMPFGGTLSLAVTLFAPEGQFSAVERRLKDARVVFKVTEAERGRTLRTKDPDGTPVEIRLTTPLT